MQKAGEPCGLSCGDAVSGNGDFDVRGAIGGDIYAVAEAVDGERGALPCGVVDGTTAHVGDYQTVGLTLSRRALEAYSACCVGQGGSVFVNGCAAYAGGMVCGRKAEC